MDFKEIYGQDVDLFYPNGRAVVAERGEWIHLAQRVKMNTVTVENGVAKANPDGILQVWVNGVLVLNRTDLRLRTNDALVDNFYISTFHGGGDATWAPIEDCYIWFDDIRIGSTYEDVMYKGCSAIDLGANKSVCVDGEASFEASVKSDDLTYTWFKDRLPIADKSSLTVSEPGTYVLVVDSLGCSQRDTVLVTKNLTSMLPENLTICDQSFVALDPKVGGEGVTFEWSKDNEMLASTSPTLLVKEGGNYGVKISSPNCEPVSDEVKVESGLLSIEDVSAQKGEMVDVNVQDAPENVGWYKSEACDELIAEGATYSTEMPATPTYIYAKDLDGFSGLVGKKGITGNTYTYSNSSMDKAMTEAWMTFTVLKDLTIDSISLYPYRVPCDIVLKILNSETNEEVYYNTFNLPVTGANRVALNVELEPGAYRFDMVGSTGILKQSHTDPDIQFPYVIEGLISIDGANKEKSWMNKVGGRYLALYDWRVSTGNHCAATPVLLSPVAGTQSGDVEQNGIVVYPTQVEDYLFVEGLNGDAKITIYNSIGAKMFYKQTKNDKLYLSMLQWSAGEYIVQIEEGAKVKSVKVVKR
jgi:hypothetical protein